MKLTWAFDRAQMETPTRHLEQTPPTTTCAACQASDKVTSVTNAGRVVRRYWRIPAARRSARRTRARCSTLTGMSSVFPGSYMPCVLIVEDDSDIREFMELLLADAGYDTMSAENGSRALERMRARRPCLVLLDLAMPVMDGWEFRERQLADPELAEYR